MDSQPHNPPRIAFFGGSFDPPHLGHLAVARAAQAALNLETVLFAPVGAQPLKPTGSTADFAHRLAMTRLAIANDPGFAVSLVDAPKPGDAPNYTLDSLHSLRSGLPAEAELFCLMGADSFAGLPRWRGASEIPFAASLVVASRPGQSLDNLLSALPAGLSLVNTASHTAPPEPSSASRPIDLHRYLLRNSSGEQAQLYLLPNLEIEISASEIRAQIRRRRSAAQLESAEHALLPCSVSDYIQAHGLYC
jgi:nicotinate-nucleotide adenylyltransferase